MAALLALYVLLITPVTVRLDVKLFHGAEATVAPRVWGLGPELRFALKDHHLVRLDGKGRAHPLTLGGRGAPRPPTPALLKALQSLTLLQLDVALCVSLGDAARTALTAGALGSVWRALPSRWRRRARLQVRPDFLGGQGGAQARCMVFFRLGTLLITAISLWISMRRSRTWNIPSVN